MSYYVVNGLPDAVPGANTVEDLQRYFDSDLGSCGRLVSCEMSDIGDYVLVWEVEDQFAAHAAHAEARHKASARHHGWDRSPTAVFDETTGRIVWREQAE